MQRKRCKLKLDINIKIVIKIYSPKIKVFVSHSRHDIESIFMLLFHFSFCSLQYYAQWQKAKVYNAGLALSKHMGHHSKVQYHFKQWCTIYRHHSIVLESIHITVIWIVLLQILFMYLYSSNFFVYSSCLFYFLGSNKNSFYSFWLYHYKPSLKKMNTDDIQMFKQKHVKQSICRLFVSWKIVDYSSFCYYHFFHLRIQLI